MEVRSFLAFELPLEIKEIVTRVSNALKKTLPDFKWVKVDNIHLTVIFMGNISVDRLHEMAEKISEVCRTHGPFTMAVRGAGVFFRRRRPTVLWIGLNGDMKEMGHFKNVLQKTLLPFGVHEEKRDFKPHLTLGRFPKGAKPSRNLDELILKHEDLSGPPATLSELVLFKSELKPGGAVYTKLNAWPLGRKKEKD